jgi:hypothetical protein
MLHFPNPQSTDYRSTIIMKTIIMKLNQTDSITRIYITKYKEGIVIFYLIIDFIRDIFLKKTISFCNYMIN